jgi:hypothetical protein
VLSMTSIEPDVGQDWLYVHSPRVSALAGLANSANSIAGIMISQRERTSGYSGFHSVAVLPSATHAS